MNEKEHELYTQDCQNQVEKTDLYRDALWSRCSLQLDEKSLLSIHQIYKNKKDARLFSVNGALYWDNLALNKMPLVRHNLC